MQVVRVLRQRRRHAACKLHGCYDRGCVVLCADCMGVTTEHVWCDV